MNEKQGVHNHGSNTEGQAKATTISGKIPQKLPHVSGGH